MQSGGLKGVSGELIDAASLEGCLMMSVPAEKDKGKAFSVFWAIVSRRGGGLLLDNPADIRASSTRDLSWAPLLFSESPLKPVK